MSAASSGPANPNDALFLAAEYGRADIISSLIREGEADVSFQREADGATALHIAVRYKNIDAVRALLKSGANVETRGRGGIFANKSSVELARDIGPHLLRVFQTETIQFIAQDDESRVSQMIKAGIDVNSTDGSSDSNSLLQWAASFGSMNALKVLIDLGADVNRPNRLGVSPLHEASHNGSVDTIRMLLDAGATQSLSAMGKGGFALHKTPVDVAKNESVRLLFLNWGKPQKETIAPQKETELPSENIVEELVETGENSTASVSNENFEEQDQRTGECDEGRVGDDEKGEEQETSNEATMKLQILQTQRLAEEKDLLISQLKRTIESLLEDRESMEALLEGKGVIDHLRTLRRENDNLSDKLEAFQRHTRMLEESVRVLHSDLSDHRESLALKASEIEAQDALIAGQRAKLSGQEKTIAELTSLLEEHREQIRRQQDVLSHRSNGNKGSLPRSAARSSGEDNSSSVSSLVRGGPSGPGSGLEMSAKSGVVVHGVKDFGIQSAHANPLPRPLYPSHNDQHISQSNNSVENVLLPQAYLERQPKKHGMREDNRRPHRNGDKTTIPKSPRQEIRQKEREARGSGLWSVVSWLWPFSAQEGEDDALQDQTEVIV